MEPDIRHHPADDLLVAHAGSGLRTGPRLVVAAHLEICRHCRARARLLDAVGGALLEGTPAADLPADALARTFDRIDATRVDAAPPAPRKLSTPPPLPEGACWPKALRHCAATPWRWIGPGMRWSKVRVPEDPQANVFLLRIAAGKYLPRHTHRGFETTQILHGRFHDGRALFGPGDFDAADADIHHQPVVQDGSECICLASLDGRLRFDGVVERLFGALVGM